MSLRHWWFTLTGRPGGEVRVGDAIFTFAPGTSPATIEGFRWRMLLDRPRALGILSPGDADLEPCYLDGCPWPACGCDRT